MRKLVVVGDARYAGLPRQAVVAVRIEVRVLLHLDQVLHVRDRRLVELLRPALLDHQAEVAVVVGEDDDVATGRLAARQLPLDLREERRVVVDVLGVGDVDARLLLEVLERRMRVRLVVRVDVQRPVRELEGLREGVVRAGARRLGAAAAAGGEHTGHREQGAARGGAAEQVTAGGRVGHFGASMESTTKVESGSQLSVVRSPAEPPFSPGDAFWRYTVRRPHSVSTMYCVATPTYACSTILPSSAFGWPLPSSIFSGRIPTATCPVLPLSVPAGTRTSGPRSRRTVSFPMTVPLIRFETPRKPATYAVAGVS